MACSLFPCITDVVILIPPGCWEKGCAWAGASSPARVPRAVPGEQHGCCLAVTPVPVPALVLAAQPGCRAPSRGLAVLPPLFIKGMTAKIHLKMKKVPANPFCETVID